MSGPRLGIIGMKHMGREHYTNVLRLVKDGRVELAALYDIDAAGSSRRPSTNWPRGRKPW